MRRRVLLVLILVIAGVAAWRIFRFTSERRNRLFQSANELTNLATNSASYSWDAAVEKVKAPRGEELGGSLEIPQELRHYEERYWFLATQVAEIEKYNVHTVQDYLDLAALIEKGELVPVPAVTETYILLGVGQRANEDPFTKFEEEEENEITTNPAEYQPLQKLAQNFNGRSFNLENPYDRHVLKINMLSTIRPQALKVIEEVSAAYKQKFNLPLPVSSLVRPEQYQHSLRRVNRNAVTIDTPPHSTGLAFDIDYRYMSVAEQNFVMNELARIKNQGRIEVIRERNANYHVFAFVNGTRPSDDLVSASLEKAGAPPPEANHTEAKPEKPKNRAVKKKTQRPRAKARVSRKRRR
ncbi:MAG TPA: DUF5715 family protein [Pyrinomonadaceae bacterium]|nr:DUF5715 family protein [Pyrinomonadaceae bacterium]